MFSIEPYILAIDSSTSVLRVGLSLDSGNVVSLRNRDRYRHAEFIFKLIKELLVKSGIGKSKLRGIIVSTGPGSFTGLRVGMASAKALAVSLNIPLVGVSTYSAIAGRLFRWCGKTGVLIPSRKNEYYFGLIDSETYDDKRTTVIKVSDLRNYATGVNLLAIDCRINEDDSSDYRVIGNEEFEISIEDYISCGHKRLVETGGDDISRLDPLYVQEFPARSAK